MSGKYDQKKNELYHSWGNTPEQKQKEREYNHQYYRANKERWERYKKAKRRQTLRSGKRFLNMLTMAGRARQQAEDMEQYRIAQETRSGKKFHKEGGLSDVGNYAKRQISRGYNKIDELVEPLANAYIEREKEKRNKELDKERQKEMARKNIRKRRR